MVQVFLINCSWECVFTVKASVGFTDSEKNSGSFLGADFRPRYFLFHQRNGDLSSTHIFLYIYLRLERLSSEALRTPQTFNQRHCVGVCAHLPVTV